MVYKACRVLPDFCDGREDLVGFAVNGMKQQIADKVLEEIIKGEQIISLDSEPVKEDSVRPESFTLTLKCRIEKLVRCKDCKWYGIYEAKKDGTPDERRNPSVCLKGAYAKRRDPNWFCADGERKET